MSNTPTERFTLAKPLRLWPGVVLVVLQWIAWFVLPRVAPDAAFAAILIAFLCGIGVLLWWLLFSRAPWVERVGAILLSSWRSI